MVYIMESETFLYRSCTDNTKHKFLNYTMQQPKLPRAKSPDVENRL